jgi:2-keto-4-pentenoate hydratase/2-oxohepta-3-ene-1,7-dioic acid hydratase in catechol pathway
VGVKLIRFGEAGREDPGVWLEDGRRLDASDHFHDYDEGFFASGGMESLAAWVEEGCPDAREIPPDARLGPPVDRPSKIVCVGQNYAEHARESGAGIPEHPVLFMKASSAWSGPHDEVVRPSGSTCLDYEVELAVVIGRTARAVSEGEAMGHIAGYAVFCDYSERRFQKELGGQWVKGKSCDGFAPMGPALTPAERVGDPQGLRLWCQVNGAMRQNGWTGDMIFGVAFLVSHISRFMTLLPGDVIATGTPAGVGMGMSPPRYLTPGDSVVCGIDGLGEMRQRVVEG